MANVIPTDKLVFQKIIALFITAVIFIMAGSTYNLMLAAIVLGYSHFIIGMIYKLASPRKIRPLRIIGFLFVGALLFGLFYRPDNPEFYIGPLLLMTTLYAIYHTVVDDEFSVNFFASGYSVLQKIEMVALILSLSALQIKWQYQWNGAIVIIGISIFLIVLYGLIVIKQKHKLQFANYYFLLLSGVSIGLYFINIQFFNQHFVILPFIGIYHYLIYYFHYYLKITSIKHPKSTLATVRGYLAIVFITNFIIFSLYFISQYSQNSMLNLLFSYNLFLLLALLHFISSTR